ncbi:aquaporin [Neomegalonema sp.]|uniref:aquaporin n=1 Tax=Neomegalonema sp. TaxID=2039713 RepID=UPI0026169FC3|nr:aquaporin [Neomegalonema sp.]MDD2868814.1 aquaporin [Neomegalonema sp.]
MQKTLAEFIGTFTLVFLACGAAIIGSGFAGLGQAGIGLPGVSLAFGFALIGAAYGIGAISGCHINPAVSFGALIAGRMTVAEFIQYVIAQCAGAIAAAFVLYVIVQGKDGGYAGGFATNGWGGPGGYNMVSAFIFEAVATFIFLVVILGSTHRASHGAVAGLAIGLVLVAIHLVGIGVTGTSVNPARSLGPALIDALRGNGAALGQLWLFIAAPLVGAAVAGFLFRAELLFHRDLPK